MQPIGAVGIVSVGAAAVVVVVRVLVADVLAPVAKVYW